MKLFSISFALFASVFFSCVDKTPTVSPVKTVVEKKSPEDIKRDEIIEYARQQMGAPYKYAGGTPNGFDCSGFVNFVFKHFDITVPRSSSGFKNVGKTVKPEDFKVGDVLVFYGYQDKNSIGHVGIICEANGMQSKFIHASSGKEMKVTISELGSEQYTRRFYKCVNVL